MFYFDFNHMNIEVFQSKFYSKEKGVVGSSQPNFLQTILETSKTSSLLQRKR